MNFTDLMNAMMAMQFMNMMLPQLMNMSSSFGGGGGGGTASLLGPLLELQNNKALVTDANASGGTITKDSQAIAALTFSSTPTQAELNAFRDAVATLGNDTAGLAGSVIVGYGGAQQQAALVNGIAGSGNNSNNALVLALIGQ